MKTNETNGMKNQITVWPDDTEGRQNRTWIVSLEGDTLSQHRSEAAAHTAGRNEASRRQVPLVTQSVDGHEAHHMDHMVTA